MSYHIDTTTNVASEVFGVSIALWEDGEELYWFSTTHKLCSSGQWNF